MVIEVQRRGSEPEPEPEPEPEIIPRIDEGIPVVLFLQHTLLQARVVVEQAQDRAPEVEDIVGQEGVERRIVRELREVLRHGERRLFCYEVPAEMEALGSDMGLCILVAARWRRLAPEDGSWGSDCRGVVAGVVVGAGGGGLGRSLLTRGRLDR